MSVAEQLRFDWPETITAALANDLRGRRRIGGGAARLLVELVRRGLDEEALVPAAGLCIELDKPREGDA